MQIRQSQTVLTLTYQSNLFAFNAAILKKLVEDKKLTVSPTKIGNQTLNVFSNENFQFIILPQNQIQFVITGKCTLENIISDIQQILTSLNYTPENQVRLGFQCETRANLSEEEYLKFTREICAINYSKIQNKLGTTSTITNGIKITTKSNTQQLDLLMELVPNTNTYSILLNYVFISQDEYSTFISNFNQEYLEDLLNGISVI